jgi:hypothetical protein
MRAALSRLVSKGAIAALDGFANSMILLILALAHGQVVASKNG